MSYGRHAAPVEPQPLVPDGVEPDAVWVPPPYEPNRPGDFVEYATAGFEVGRSRRTRLVLIVVLVVALAGGGWYYLIRPHGGSSVAVGTCADAQQEVSALTSTAITVTTGGRIPTGIPAPRAAPGLTCTARYGSTSVVLAAWIGGSESDYSALLSAGGWSVTSPRGEFTMHANGADRRAVATMTRDGVLVAAYVP